MKNLIKKLERKEVRIYVNNSYNHIHNETFNLKIYKFLRRSLIQMYENKI